MRKAPEEFLCTSCKRTINRLDRGANTSVDGDPLWNVDEGKESLKCVKSKTDAIKELWYIKKTTVASRNQETTEKKGGTPKQSLSCVDHCAKGGYTEK